MNDIMFSSKSDNYPTPKWLFEQLDREFHFDLDPCADDINHKCDLYYTKEQNGLAQSWAGHSVYCNPPYGRKVGKWVQKAYESFIAGALVVMLLPARTDTKWFHEYINGIAEVRFLRGRLVFEGATNMAPFPSMIVVFRKRVYNEINHL